MTDPRHTCFLDFSFLVWFWSSRSADLSLLFSRTSRARHTRGRLGGLPDQTTTPFRGRTPVRHRLKIALVFDLVFLRFVWSILASKMAPKMDQKPLKITSEIDLDFHLFFHRFFDRFFANSVPAEPQKTFKNIRF